MASLAETMDWASEDDQRDLRRYLGLAPEDKSEDRSLEPWFRLAVLQGDLWLANDFKDAAGIDLGLPESVRVGVWEFVKSLRERSRKISGVKSVKTAQLAESYADQGISGLAGLAAAIPYWQPYKTDLTTAGM